MFFSFDCKQQTFDYICDHISIVLGKDAIIKGIIPINVCAHCGPGTVGLVISPKINGKSLAEYM